MSGRIIVVQFRGASCEVVYQMRISDPETLTWRFADAQCEVPTETERASINAICLKDLRERKAEWQAQILRRRIVPALRRKKCL